MPDKNLMQEDAGEVRVDKPNFYGHPDGLRYGDALGHVGAGPMGRVLGEAFERGPGGWADAGGWYERLPPLYTPANWGAVLNLPEIEEWLQRTAGRVRDLAEVVQHDASNRHIDLHLVQLKDISEDISSHVEVVHALLETAFPLRLLAVSVQVLLDIQAAHLLWHQLRVSTLVLRERIVRCLQDSNGNFTRQPDILQAVGSSSGEHSCLESLGSVEDLQNLIVKCSKDYFSLDCGITAIELSDYSPKEEEAAPHAYPDGQEPPEAMVTKTVTTAAEEEEEEPSQSLTDGRDVGLPGADDKSHPPAHGFNERQDRAAHTGGGGGGEEVGLPVRARARDKFSALLVPAAVPETTGNVPSEQMVTAGDDNNSSAVGEGWPCQTRPPPLPAGDRASRIQAPHTTLLQNSPQSTDGDSQLDSGRQSMAAAERSSAPQKEFATREGSPAAGAIRPRCTPASSPPDGDSGPPHGMPAASPAAACQYFQALSSFRGDEDGDEVSAPTGGAERDSVRGAHTPEGHVAQGGSLHDDGVAGAVSICSAEEEREEKEEDEEEKSYLTLSHGPSVSADGGEPPAAEGGRAGDAGDPGDSAFSDAPGTLPCSRISTPLRDSAEYLAPPTPPPSHRHVAVAAATAVAARDLDDWELSEAASEPGSPERGHGTPVPWDESDLDAKASRCAGLGIGLCGKPFRETYLDPSSDDDKEEEEEKVGVQGDGPSTGVPELTGPAAGRWSERGCTWGLHPDDAHGMMPFMERLEELEQWAEAAVSALRDWTACEASAGGSPSLRLNPGFHRVAMKRALADGLALLSLPQLARSGLKGKLARVEQLWREASEGARRARGVPGVNPPRTEGTGPEPQQNELEATGEEEDEHEEETEDGEDGEEATSHALGMWLCDVEAALGTAVAEGPGPVTSRQHRLHDSLLQALAAELPLWRRRVEPIAVRAAEDAAEGVTEQGTLHPRLQPLLEKWNSAQVLLQDACPLWGGDSAAVRALLGADAAALLSRLGLGVRHLRRWLLHAEWTLLQAVATSDGDTARDLDANIAHFKALCAEIRQRRRGMVALLQLCHRMLEQEDSATVTPNSDGSRSLPRVPAPRLHTARPPCHGIDAEPPATPDGAPRTPRRSPAESYPTDGIRLCALWRGCGMERVEAASVEAGQGGEVRLLAEGMERRWEALVLQAVHWQSRLQRCSPPDQAVLKLVDASLADLCCSCDEGLEWDETDLDNELLTSAFDEARADDDPTSAYFSTSAPRGPAPRGLAKEEDGAEEGMEAWREPSGPLVYQVYNLHDISLDADPTLTLDYSGYGLFRSPGKAKGLVKSASKDSSFSSTESLLNLLDGLLGDGWGSPGVGGECESGIASEGDAATVSDSRTPGGEAGPGERERVLNKEDELQRGARARLVENEQRQGCCDDRESTILLARSLSFFLEETHPAEYVVTSSMYSTALGPGVESPPPPCFLLPDRDGASAAEKSPSFCDAGTVTASAVAAGAMPELPSPTSTASLAEDERDLPSMNSSADSMCMGGEERYYSDGALAGDTPRSLAQVGPAPGTTAAASYLSKATLELLQQLEKASGHPGGRLARSTSDVTLESGSLRLTPSGAQLPPEERPRGREDSAASISELSDGSCDDVSLSLDDREASASLADDVSVSMIVNISGTSVCSDDGDDDTDLLSSSTVTLSDDDDDDGDGDFCVDEETSSSSGSWEDDDDESEDSESFSEDEHTATTTTNDGFYLRPPWDASHHRDFTTPSGNGGSGDSHDMRRSCGSFYARFSRPDILATTLMNPLCGAGEGPGSSDGGLLPSFLPGPLRGVADPDSASNADFENGNVDESPYLSSFEDDSLFYENPEGEMLYAPEGQPVSKREFLNKKKKVESVARAAAEASGTGSAHRFVKKSQQRWSHAAPRGDERGNAAGPSLPGAHSRYSTEPSSLRAPPTLVSAAAGDSAMRVAGGVTRSSSASSISFSRISDAGSDSVEIDCAAVAPCTDVLTLAMEAQLSSFEAEMVEPLRRRREPSESASLETGIPRPPLHGVSHYVTEIIEIASAALVQMSSQGGVGYGATIGNGASIFGRTSSFRQRNERKPVPHSGEPRKCDAAYSYAALLSRDTECGWELSSCDDDMSSTPLLLLLDEDVRSEEDLAAGGRSDGEHGLTGGAPSPASPRPPAVWATSTPPLPDELLRTTDEVGPRSVVDVPQGNAVDVPPGAATAPLAEGLAPPMLPPRRPLPPLPPPRIPPPPPPRRSSSLPPSDGIPTILTASSAVSPMMSPTGVPPAHPGTSPGTSPSVSPAASPPKAPPAASPTRAPPATPEDDADEDGRELQLNQGMRGLRPENVILDENRNSEGGRPTERTGDGERRPHEPAWTQGQDRNKNDLLVPPPGSEKTACAIAAPGTTVRVQRDVIEQLSSRSMRLRGGPGRTADGPVERGKASRGVANGGSAHQGYGAQNGRRSRALRPPCSAAGRPKALP